MPAAGLHEARRVEEPAQVEPPGVYFPVRLRCTAVHDLLAASDLEAALVRALGRAFAHVRAALPIEAAVGAGVALNPPTLRGGDLAPEDAAALLDRVGRAIERAAREAGVPLANPRSTAVAPSSPSEAPKPGAEVAEPFDPRRFDPATATYDVPSYRGGRERVPAHAARDPFAPLHPLFDNALAVLGELMHYLDTVPNPNDARIAQMAAVEYEYGDIESESRASRALGAVLVGRMREADIPADIAPVVAELRRRYQSSGHPFPAPGRLAERALQLRRGLALMELVRVQVAMLDRQADAAAAAGADDLRQALMDVGSYYLELLTVRSEDAFERLAFLATFYRDPQRISAYAVLRFGRKQVDMLWRNLRHVSAASGDSAGILGDIDNTNPVPLSFAAGPRQRLTVATADRALWLKSQLDGYGDLPKLPTSGGEVPDGGVAAQVAAWIIQLQVAVALLDLWQPFDAMRGLLNQYPQVGTSLNPFVSDQDQDRNVWLRQMTQLEDQFTAEAARYPHPGFDQRAAGWQRQVQALINHINTAVRHARVAAAVVEMVPLLFVGGAVAEGVGAWVAELTNGSRWLVAIAQGATLTALNVIGAPPGNPRRPASGTGLASQLVVNVLLSRLGPVIGAFGEDSTQALLRTRAALLAPIAGVAIRGAQAAGFAVLQSAAHALVAKVSGQRGESSFTELLTINILLNGLGMALGASLEQSPPGDASLARTGTGSPGALSGDPAELARQLGVSEDMAREILQVAGRFAEYQQNLEAARASAEAGSLTAADFEAWRRRSLDLVDDLASRLPDLAEAVGSGLSRAEITGFLAQVRTQLQTMSFAGDVRLLPEFVPGLVRVGEGSTWAFDPARPPAAEAIAALQRSFSEQGSSVRLLPGGGWEADTPGGRPVFLALPAPPGVKALLPPAPVEAARGPQARAGLANVQAQTATPQLEPQLAAAIVRSGRTTVTTLLRELAPLDQQNDAIWRGLSNYLAKVGDPALLARILSFREEPSYAAQHATRLLTQMAAWDQTALQGLEALYRVRPHTTSDELANLLGTFPPDQVEGILHAIGTLADRSQGLGQVLGPLFRDPSLPNRAQEIGAQGTLASAVQLARQFPTARLDFEVEVTDAGGAVIRRQDINVNDAQTGHTLMSYEIKEVSGRSLGNRRVRHELAVDILVEAGGGAVQGPAHEPFSTFRWRVRAADLARQAASHLGISDTSDPRVEPEMRQLVHDDLKAAFEDPILRSLGPDVLERYRTAFDHGVPFVEFF